MLFRHLLIPAFGLIGLAPIISYAGTSTAKAEAIFAGGCFWCMEEVFEKVPGVLDVVSGYTGGNTPNPDYQSVGQGNTGHAEAVRITYDTSKINYGQLLQIFWKNVDPTVKDRQFCDSGSQYRSAIFYLNPEQKAEAEKSKSDLLATGKFKQVYTTVEAAKPFYVAEDFHQDYYKLNPMRYKTYKLSCGRPNRLNELWGPQQSRPQ